MKKLFVLFLAVLLVFAFISCKNEPSGNSGSGGGGGSDMTPEEQAILDEYGEDTFYFAELADSLAGCSDFINDVCGAADADERAAVVNSHNAMSQGAFSISGASATGVTITMNDAGSTMTAVISQVAFAGSTVSYSGNITVTEGSKSESATVGLEIDLLNNTTTITYGKCP